MPDTITFSEKNKGWSGFFDYIPNAMVRLNNRFFMVKDGQLHLANDKDNPVRNNFFGVQYNSKIKGVINQNPSDDKIFKTFVQESNEPWATVLKTNLTESEIKVGEFNERESRQFAYIRKNEIETDLSAGVQGIGAILSSSQTFLSFGQVSEAVSIGDKLYQVSGGINELIGTIVAKTATTLNVSPVLITPINGNFCFAKKSSRIEGAEMRGYYMEFEMENTDTHKVELFGISVNAVKSYL